MPPSPRRAAIEKDPITGEYVVIVVVRSANGCERYYTGHSKSARRAEEAAQAKARCSRNI